MEAELASETPYSLKIKNPSMSRPGEESDNSLYFTQNKYFLVIKSRSGTHSQ